MAASSGPPRCLATPAAIIYGNYCWVGVLLTQLAAINSPFLLLSLRAGWLNQVLTPMIWCHFFLKC